MKKIILLAFVIATVFVLLGCGSTKSANTTPTIDVTSYTYNEIAINEVQRAMNRQGIDYGFKVQIPLGNTSWVNLPYFYYRNNGFSLNHAIGNSFIFDDRFFTQKDNLEILLRQISLADKPYTLYFIPRSAINIGTTYAAFLVKIENLPSVDELDTLEAKKIAAQEAEQEAHRQFLANFTVVPSNFRPSQYTAVDLFTAVSTIERMQGVSRNSGAGDLAMTTRNFVSEVVFVNQNGTDILFRTADNAISQYMKIDDRSGLTANQRVRIYYRVTKHPLADWRVVAIERL